MWVGIHPEPTTGTASSAGGKVRRHQVPVPGRSPGRGGTGRTHRRVAKTATAHAPFAGSAAPLMGRPHFPLGGIAPLVVGLSGGGTTRRCTRLPTFSTVQLCLGRTNAAQEPTPTNSDAPHMWHTTTNSERWQQSTAHSQFVAALIHAPPPRSTLTYTLPAQVNLLTG